MYTNIIKKIFITLTFLSMSGEAISEIAQKARNTEEWVQSLNKKSLLEINMPQLLVFIQKFSEGGILSGYPTFQKIDARQCEKATFMSCVSYDDLQYSLLINPPNSIKGLASVLKMTGADIAVYSDNGKQKAINSSQNWKSELGPTPSDNQINQAFTDKLMKALGYDGVVLASEKGYLLVGSTEWKLNKEGIQGLSIKNSEGKMFLESVNRDGAGLISLVQTWRGYGVFQEVISGGEKGIPVGAKIILEQKK